MARRKYKHKKAIPLRWWFVFIEAVFLFAMLECIGKDGVSFLTFFISFAVMGFFTFRAFKTKKAKNNVVYANSSTVSKNGPISHHSCLALDDSLVKCDYIAFDTETTGLVPHTDRIIEFAALKFINDQLVDSFSSLINPGILLDSKVAELTGITDDDLENQPAFEEVADKLIEFIGDLPLLAHNGGFDARFLAAELQRANRFLSFTYIDTLRMTRSIFPEIQVHKLNYLIKALGISKTKQTHRAYDDAALCQKVFICCKNKVATHK